MFMVYGDGLWFLCVVCVYVYGLCLCNGSCACFWFMFVVYVYGVWFMFMVCVYVLRLMCLWFVVYVYGLCLGLCLWFVI